MLPGIDNSIRPMASATAPVPVTSGSQPQQELQGLQLNSTQVVVGKQFQGEVMARLEDGSYIVNIADTAARMQLPAGTTLGAKLPLTLISLTPRATFLLSVNGQDKTTTATLGTTQQLIDEFGVSAEAGAGTGGTGAPGLSLYLHAGANVAATTAESNAGLLNSLAQTPDSTPATLSSAGKLINQLIQDSASTASTPVSTSKIPLLSEPPATAAQLSQALQHGVSTSGLFYESHLQQWAEGQRSTSDLMKEPQAQLPATTQSATPQNSMMQLVTSPETSTLIGQQLHTLEQQRISWQGQLWPGQSLQMEISRDAPDKNRAAAEPSWSSTVSFELPQLGTISGHLQLIGDHLHIKLQTDTSAVANTLRQHADDLAGALQGSGATLDSLLVKPATSSITDAGN